MFYFYFLIYERPWSSGSSPTTDSNITFFQKNNFQTRSLLHTLKKAPRPKNLVTSLSH